jgi:hypothetical protein
MTTINFSLHRDAFGRLNLTDATGALFENIAPVRSFPIQAPEEGLALVNTDGKEIAWLERLSDLPVDQAELIREELAGREFMPEVSAILSVTSYATPCTWTVKTNRGDTQFVLRGEEDIRRIGTESLLIADTHGINFLIRDQYGLDKHSKKILDRFL